MTKDQFLDIKEELQKNNIITEHDVRQQQEFQNSIQNQAHLHHEMAEPPHIVKKPNRGESTMRVSDHVEEIELDGIPIVCREYESDDDSFMDEDEYVNEYFQKATYEDAIYNGADASQMHMAMGYKGPQNDDFEMGIVNGRGYSKKPAYPNMQSYPWDDQATTSSNSGPFMIKKTVETNKDSNMKYLQAQKDENDQIFEALQRIQNNDNINTYDRGNLPYDSSRTRANGYSVAESEQPIIYPSADRIHKDMKAYENKFYERYLSQGYKLCE